MSFADAQRDGDDAGHRFRHPAENQAVHEQAKVDGAKAAQKGGRLAGVAHLRELHIGQQSRAPPQTGEEKNRHHARRQEAPPEPVSGDSLPINEPGYNQGSVGGEGCGHHRRPRQPPGDAASGDEVIVHALAGTPAKVQAEDQGDGKISGNRRPIEKGEVHAAGEHNTG